MAKCKLGYVTVLLLYSFLGTTVADTASVFERLKGLAGKWQGTFEWSGDRSGSGSATVDYYLTGNSSAVVENLAYEKAPVMTSVYHLDGNSLRMTHYCAAGNQPRLKAASFDKDEKTIQFEFVDSTNLAIPEAPHVNQVQLSFENENEINLIFTFLNHGKESYERIHLLRVKEQD